MYQFTNTVQKTKYKKKSMSIFVRSLSVSVRFWLLFSVKSLYFTYLKTSLSSGVYFLSSLLHVSSLYLWLYKNELSEPAVA